MKKVIIAIDSFKGCLTSAEANAAAARAFDGRDDYAVTTYSVSDGGEGMLQAFAEAIGADIITVPAHDALMRRHEAQIAVKGNTAIIEVAQAVGLTLIEPEQRNPLRATSYGVGEMIAHALNCGCRHLIVGLGGTATSDCGLGMLHALNDRQGHHGLIDDQHLGDIQVTLASDVTNPLLGPNGAAAVFAPQKGATPDMVKLLERRAETFAKASAAHCGHDASATPGAGAAGGLGYAFLQFFNAHMESGADLLLRLLHFDEAVSNSQLVITGEGSADRQTLMGKLPQRVMAHALQSASRPQVWLLAGRVSDEADLLKAGFNRVESINQRLAEGENPLDKAVAERNMASAIRRLL